MGRKTIPAGELFEEWREDPAYVAACANLEAEFALAAALIDAQVKAGLMCDGLAEFEPSGAR